MIRKVCGMREAGNIREVEALGIDWMGFIFWAHSARNVSLKPDYLPSRCKRVGVFVNAPMAFIREKVREFGLDILQLHGGEDADFIRQLRTELPSLSVVKALNVAREEDLEQSKRYEGLCDYFLFDTKAEKVGGNGKAFDWDILHSYKGNTPFLLSGGIGPDDKERLRAFHHPQMAGIDLNSRFEIRPAVKDIHLLTSFLHEQD
jgi:phosphoribosylanthranilate isomerase